MTLRMAQGISCARHSGVVVADQQRWNRAWIATGMGWRSQRLAAGTIWLQAGSHHWDVVQIQEVRQQHERLRTASYELLLSSGDRASVWLRMPAAVVALRLSDPTYDEIDSWADDIMKILPYIAADGWQSSAEDPSSWVRRVLPAWEEGFKHCS